MSDRALFGSPLRLAALALAGAILFGIFHLGAEPFAAGLFSEPWDKLAHFLTYAVLAASLAVACAGKRPLLVIAAVSVIGALDEWHQMVIPGRSAELADFLTDEVAAVLAVAVYEYFLMRRSNNAAQPG